MKIQSLTAILALVVSISQFATAYDTPISQELYLEKLNNCLNLACEPMKQYPMVLDWSQSQKLQNTNYYWLIF